MSIRTAITPVLMSLIAAASLLPLASSANARDFDRHGGGKGNYGSQFKQHGKYNHSNRGWRGRDNQYSYGGHRGHRRDHTGRNLAIGAFATILGIAIASEVNRDRRDYDY